jgi:Dolichyl-phosphate-mannose-protein mannosyltransferase
MWWDEGWTLSVARTIAERDLYARLLDGQPVANGLEAAIPVTEAVALSFRLFGVGLWQGRLPFVVLATIALAVLWFLSERLFDRQIAWATLATALLLAPHPQLHALVQGRQILAEVPMFVALLSGLICADFAVRRHVGFILPAILFWGVALSLKAQTLPFLMVGLACGVLVALILRRWRISTLLLIGMIGSYLLLPQLWSLYVLLAAPPFRSLGVTGLYDVSAFVTTASNRQFALTMFLLFGLVTGAGLIYGIWHAWLDRHNKQDHERLILRVVLLSIAGSWMVWFILLSVGVPRYMFPAVFLGAPFVAVLLRTLTNGFDGFGTLRRMAAPLRERRINRDAGAAWLATLLLILTLPFGMLTLTRYYLLYTDDAAQRTAAFFNTQTPPNTRIETYESELHFLLNRRYHWPPDQVHVELNRRSLLGQQTPVEYDALAADPDYLVIGEFARGNQLYQPLITDGHFRLQQKIGGYEVYVRVR